MNPVSGVARALYSYQAQSAEELSFQEGALIQLIRCRHAEVCVICTNIGTEALLIPTFRGHTKSLQTIHGAPVNCTVVK